MITIEHIVAKVAHEINRAYCASIGDDSQLPWDEAPEWQKESILKGVEMHLANPNTTPEQSHEAWMAHKAAEGWVYGEVKDPEAKTHPAMLPYDQLPTEQRTKDYLFKQTVHSMAYALNSLVQAAKGMRDNTPQQQVGGSASPLTPGLLSRFLRDCVAVTQVIQNKVTMKNLAESLENEQLHIDAQSAQEA